MKDFEKFLEFNGKRISLLAKDGTWWVAIKPICEALSVDYHRQFKNLKSDEILCELLSEQTTVAADNKLRKMVCLPERYIYGWLFSIRSDSADLKAYKKECYDILFNHFNRRSAAVLEKLAIDHEMNGLKTTLNENEDFRTYMKLERRKNDITNAMRRMDKNILKGQTRMDL